MKNFFAKIVAFAKKKPFLFFVIACLTLVVLIPVANFGIIQIEKHPDISCSPCHIMKPYTDGYQHGELLSNAHKKAKVACIDCHQNGIGEKINEIIWYVSGDYDDPVAKKDFGNEMCTKCHDDLNKIIAKTDYGHDINPHHSHLGDLTCSECHKMHNKSVASCQNCHDFEFLQKLPPQWRKLQVGDLKTMLENTGGK